MDKPVEHRGPRVNERIRIREVRLIDDAGQQLGVMPTEKALELAREKGLDLVEVAPDSRPPVCKILDYSKFKYEEKKRKRESAKKQHKVITKEVRLRPKTGEHDYQVKIKHARRFLSKGYKVQVNVLFRGRERAHTDIARGHLDRMAEDLVDVVDSFDGGAVVHTGDDLGVDEYADLLQGNKALAAAASELTDSSEPAHLAAAVELVLEGLHLSKRLNKEAIGPRATYRGRG